VIYSHPAAVSALGWFFEALAIAALGFEGFAFIDAIRRPKQAFVAASKQTKPLWLVITGVATVIGLGTAAYSASPIGILAIAAFVAAAIYLTDVRPKVKDFRSGGTGTRMGPYGPW
jgi:EamA domain-containing membrane protein RarD